MSLVNPFSHRNTTEGENYDIAEQDDCMVVAARVIVGRGATVTPRRKRDSVPKSNFLSVELTRQLAEVFNLTAGGKS